MQEETHSQSRVRLAGPEEGATLPLYLMRPDIHWKIGRDKKMPAISPKVFEKLAEVNGWHAYIKSTILCFDARSKGQYELAFKESAFTTEMPFERAKKLL